MIEAGARLLGNARCGSWANFFDQCGNENVRPRWKSNMQRATAAVMTGAVRTRGRLGIGIRAPAVLRHAHGHLCADGHENQEAQPTDEKLHWA